MDIDRFFIELEELLNEIGLETAILKGDDPKLSNTLRAMAPMTEAGGHVLLEIMTVPYTDDAYLLQIYTTMLAEIGPGYDVLKDALLDWNLTCPLGAFGIYKRLRQFYHKYNYLMPVDVPADEMADEVFYILNLVLEAISRIYPDAVRISGNV